MKRVMSVLLLAGAVVGTTIRPPPAPGVPASTEHRRIAAGGCPATLRAGAARPGCGLKSPLGVMVRALSTPLVGRDLELEITISNGLADGAVHSWLRLPPGLDAAAEPSWTDIMTLGASVRHRATVRVNSGAPLPVTAKAASLDSADQLRPPGEGYVTLYPLEITPAGVRARWNATTLRALADPGPPVIRLRGGDRAAVIRGN